MLLPNLDHAKLLFGALFTRSLQEECLFTQLSDSVQSRRPPSGHFGEQFRYGKVGVFELLEGTDFDQSAMKENAAYDERLHTDQEHESALAV